jgi:hypothetical protein
LEHEYRSQISKVNADDVFVLIIEK